ncbi:LysR family transcriptional regulator [Pusillimonas noertemannii]|uniref:LysR family transcriptional regulator n=1 Tax=Pusillimonas noertemannii TaxID=305977 RepID=A0A2U1CQG4_9BURK|nr:LysR family transcriptional regulator [Pusillimonas noertemannii]NYT67452.1 LysR family transcriptional regulator [Pusillimonas noertemannii]PVY68125.1 LysR family transcriptional regulator [Pusillimonas noertemannii]TFL12373.1 LysR family transcriptional regulator [Pusillimonas noertemannii]
MNPSVHLNLRHLRVFIAVAQQGSISKAADTLYRAQSAVSRSIRQLEQALDAQLFERRSSGMLPTAFGQALLYRAERAAGEFQLARNELASRLRKANGSPNAPVFDMLFNENRLRIFIDLAQSHHMPTVARAHGITQPAVSASIGELEASLGIPLFDRTAKGMMANEAGHILLVRAKRALAELRHVEADIAALSGKTQGIVNIGSHPLSRTVLLPTAIARVLEAHPNLCVSIVPGSTEVLRAGLRTGDLDFILGTLRQDEVHEGHTPGSGVGPQPAERDDAADLDHIPLLTDRMSLFVRAGHPLTKLPRIGIDDLMRAKWLLPTSRTPSRAVFDRAFKRMSGTVPQSPVETSDLSVLRSLLLSSDLVTAMSPQQLDLECRLGVLQPLDFEFEESARIIALTQRAGSQPSPGAAALIATVRQVAAEMRAA